MTMPGFTGDASLYKRAGHYRTAATASAGHGTIAPAQLLSQFLTGPKGCTVGPVDTSIWASGCQRVCNIGGEIIETCVSSSNCFPVSCGACLLTIPQTVVSELLTGQPIDTSQLIFTQTCHQGPTTFTRPCTRCGPEFRISLPIISDKCITVCSGGLDPTLFSVSVRDC